MDNRKYFLGVDGGGSKTTAVVFDDCGNFVCKACGESINYYSVGLNNARTAMKNIIGKLTVKEYAYAVIGMSALNDRAGGEETDRFCSEIIFAENIIMDSDLFVALEAMGADAECATVISGTGSMAVYRDKHGNISHAGGWGYILGDEGSGYSIGLAGIKAAIKSAENCGPETALLAECLKYFSTDNIYDLIDLYYEKTVSRKTTAAFARAVNECAENGDKTAECIIETEAKELANTALGLFNGKAAEEFPVGLWGGVFQNNRIFRDKFINILSDHNINDVKLIDFTPEVGAIFAGYKACGIELIDIVKDNIRKSYMNSVL